MNKIFGWNPGMLPRIQRIWQDFMSIQGYFGIMLDINLCTCEVTRFRVPEEDLRLFVGGRGLGMKLLWDCLKEPGLDPLDPSSPLLFMPGPFSGLPIPSSSRTSVICKSPGIAPLDSPYPHASAISHSSMGGFIGPEIRFAGYDGIIIRGKAKHPVYLYILDDQVEIRDASVFWGMNTRVFKKAFKNHLGDPDFQTCFIGQAGERLNPLASIITSSANAAGRGGSGCVMGSKNLKAMAIRGTGMPNVADPVSLGELLKKARQSFSDTRPVQREIWKTMEQYPAKKSEQDGSPDPAAIHLKSKDSCYCCPVPCKKGNHSLASLRLPFYQNPFAKRRRKLGKILNLDAPKTLDQAICIMDDYGMDIFAAGSIIRFLVERFEHKELDPARINGLKISPGDEEAILEMIHKMGKMEGLGKVASLGISHLAKTFGKTPLSLNHSLNGKTAHKEVLTSHPPEASESFFKNKRGQCHFLGGSPSVQNQLTLQDSLGACNFASPWYRNELAYHHLLQAITGMEWTADSFEKAGERIINLERHLNHREGFSRQDDRLSQLSLMGAHATGLHPDHRNIKKQVDRLLDECYQARGWNPATAAPEREKLKELDLGFVLNR